MKLGVFLFCTLIPAILGAEGLPSRLVLPGPTWPGPNAPTLKNPVKVAMVAWRGADPVWTPLGLYANAPTGILGLSGAEHSGPAVYDRSVGAFFAMANGQLVRLDDGDRLFVVAEDVQGTDVDVYALAGLAVSREPDDTIVLHRFGPAGEGKVVLLRGQGFFGPRFSPDGKQVLVAESRAEGGHMWVVAVEDGRARDLGQGYGATWHPDGRTVVFSRIVHDSLRIWSADLYALDVATGAERILAITADRAEIEPAVSPDGRFVAFVDALTGDLLVAMFPDLEVAP